MEALHSVLESHVFSIKHLFHEIVRSQNLDYCYLQEWMLAVESVEKEIDSLTSERMAAGNFKFDGNSLDKRIRELQGLLMSNHVKLHSGNFMLSIHKARARSVEDCVKWAINGGDHWPLPRHIDMSFMKETMLQAQNKEKSMRTTAAALNWIVPVFAAFDPFESNECSFELFLNFRHYHLDNSKLSPSLGPFLPIIHDIEVYPVLKTKGEQRLHQDLFMKLPRRQPRLSVTREGFLIPDHARALMESAQRSGAFSDIRLIAEAGEWEIAGSRTPDPDPDPLIVARLDISRHLGEKGQSNYSDWKELLGAGFYGDWVLLDVFDLAKRATNSTV